jgi:two-component system response regulator ResD
MSLPGRLLVVEQEEQVRGLLRMLLMRSGYEVQTAGTGEEVTETMKASTGFDAVLSEAALPGMNGHELASHLAIRYPSTKVIFVPAINVECERCPTPCSVHGSQSRSLRKNWLRESPKF